MVAAVLDSLARATESAPGWAKAWHNWALYNVSAMEHHAHNDVATAQRHVAPAVSGFFRSVALSQQPGQSEPFPWLLLSTETAGAGRMHFLRTDWLGQARGCARSGTACHAWHCPCLACAFPLLFEAKACLAVMQQV